MGLLDNFQIGGQAASLLDFLRNNALNQQMPSGLPQDQARYNQNPPMSAMAMQPQATPQINPQSSQMAPSTMQQPGPQPMPQMQPPQLPMGSPAGGLGAGLQGFLQNLHTGPLGAIAGGIGSAAGMQSPEHVQANQTAQYLVKSGMDPALAKSVVSDPALLRAVLPGIMGTGGQTDDIKEYQFAKKEDPSLTFASFMQKKKSVSGEFGMQPIWGTGPDGKPAVLQLGKSGDAKQSVLPQGFNLSRDPIKVEGPTGTTILDPQTRLQVAFIPKDVAGAAKSKEVGEAEGQALVNLPTTIATAENTLKTIKQLEDHPGKKNWGAFGLGAMLPDRPGSETRGFAALVDQVKGQNFMTAFQSLKGAGAITETEGAKAERAQARLDRAQSEKDFDIALKDLKEVVGAGMERARQKAGVKHSEPQTDLKKKYGLD